MKRIFGPKIPTTVRVKRESDRFSRPKAASISESYSGTAPILYEDPEEQAKVDQQTQNYKKYVRDLVLLYHIQARNMMIMHYGSQLIIIIGAGIVSVLVGVGLPEIPKFIPAILSGVVAIVAAISNQFKFGERYRVRVLTAVNIEQGPLHTSTPLRAEALHRAL